MSLSRHFLTFGQYEPEGIYLALPLAGECRVLQAWGAHAAFHAHFTYSGVRLKGHPGLDLAADPGAEVLATDAGRVTEISNEPGGFGYYIKVEHRWGESLYANLGTMLVEAGQAVVRGQLLAKIEVMRRPYATHLHFAIRVLPYNRFDGWGGFSDPLPFMVVPDLVQVDDEEIDQPEASLPKLLEEFPGVRRP